MHVTPAVKFYGVAVPRERHHAAQVEVRPLAEPVGQRLRQVDGQVLGQVGRGGGGDADPAAQVGLADLQAAGAVAVCSLHDVPLSSVPESNGGSLVARSSSSKKSPAPSSAWDSGCPGACA